MLRISLTIVLLILSADAALAQATAEKPGGPAAPTEAQSYEQASIAMVRPEIKVTASSDFSYRPSIAVMPGRTLTLKGVRGRGCGDPAPSWDDVAAGLPTSTTGTFSDGGIGTVRSRSCGKAVPARGIRFTATTRGRERFTLFRDRIAITVF